MRYDVLPAGNRLLLFWSDEDCPHEVLPTRRDRYAMTVWYRAADDILGEPAAGATGGLDHLVKNLHPVAPLTVEDALARAGATPSQAKRANLTYRFHVEERGRGGDQGLAAYLARHGL